VSARVPFALLGVVLLVGSGTIVGTLQTPAATDPDVDRAMDRASAETQSALREAAITAARAAAREPVTVRADTAYGRVLNRSSAFRDALRIRLYLRARQSLGTLSERRGSVRIQASLPAVERPADLRAAKRRVRVERAGPGGTAMRVRIEGVTLTASRGGRVVGTRTVSPTLVVPTPTLAVHDRVRRFERRLDAGPLDPGLGRRLTARLYPVVWARGYAQYGGTPIENVLANRHVALFTNSGILALQRDIFGHSDPVGRRAFRLATADAALTDLLAGTDFAATETLQRAHEEVGLTPAPTDALDAAGGVTPSVRPNETVTVGIGDTAARAFVDSEAVLDRTLRETYAARVALKQRVRHLGTRQVREPRAPGPGWGIVRSSTRTAVRVRDREPGPPHAARGTGTHVLGVHGRTVVRTHTTTYRWRGPKSETTTTTGRTIERSAVTLTLVGNHTQGPAPTRPVALVHERGGPFDGPNLADVRGLAYDRLVASRGGLDRLAERATGGTSVARAAVVRGERPPGLEAWVYADIADLRERARNVSMTTTRGELATYQSNPPAALAGKLRARRAALVDVPETYPNVAQRARVAARTEYVDRLIDVLDRRGRARQANIASLRERLSDPGRAGDPIERLREGYERRGRRDPPGRLGGLRMRVDAEPAYLTRSALDHEAVNSIAPGTEEHPLVTRNRNVAAVPYGDAVDALVGALLGPDTTRLRTAAQVLRTVERTNSSVGVDQSVLERQVRAGTARGLAAARATLAEFDVGDGASRRAAVVDATSSWDTPAARALAVTNGSAADAIHAAALDRWAEDLSDRSRDLLALRLRVAVHEATTSGAARPTEPAVNGTTRDVRTELRERLASEAGDALSNATAEGVGRSLARLPAGLPVAPAPGFWYATVNLWRVEIAGEFPRFTVRVPRGTPDRPGAQLHYVRETAVVRFDVDGDGSPERVGNTTRVSFQTGTEVAIAVPPGPQGVGDVDGEADETSPGWPDPGPSRSGADSK